MRALLDGEPIEFWHRISVKRDSVLKIGTIEGTGQRSYLAVQGGFDVPRYMGSRATFTLGQFGGHAGRALRNGDVLRLDSAGESVPHKSSAASVTAIPPALRGSYANLWNIAVLDGPQGAPDFFTAEDIAALFATDWQVHYNSSRTGVRLIGPSAQPLALSESSVHDELEFHDTATLQKGRGLDVPVRKDDWNGADRLQC